MLGSFVLINDLTSNSGRACTDLNRLSPILILGSESLKILDDRELAVDLWEARPHVPRPFTSPHYFNPQDRLRPTVFFVVVYRWDVLS